MTDTSFCTFFVMTMQYLLDSCSEAASGKLDDIYTNMFSSMYLLFKSHRKDVKNFGSDVFPDAILS